jgi:NTE family protein
LAPRKQVYQNKKALVKVNNDYKYILSSLNMRIPKKQRALVLGGGGALGAYEAGVIKILCQEIYKQDHEYKDEKNNPQLFDIIVGTSIGAMNGAVLLSEFLNTKRQNEREGKRVIFKDCWDEAVEKLYEFWKKQLASNPDITEIQKPWYDKWKDKKNNNNPDIACEETARRYYSVKKLLQGGAPNIYEFSKSIEDKKFFDKNNKWYLYDNKRLKESIKQYVKSTILTDYNKNEPRLLVFAVDVAEGKTVTFDSYPNSITEKNINEQESKKKSNHIKNGICIEQIMASGTLPGFYEYTEIDERKFWDGGLLSNVPFRELLQAHKEYWVNIVSKKDKNNIPDLEVYIVNLHPSKQLSPPKDYDGVNDRKNDIIFGDRCSHHDQSVANLITDYKDFISEIKDLSLKAISKVERNRKREKLQKKFDKVMRTAAISKDSKGNDLRYKDLIKGQFRLSKVQRIEFNDYTNSIYGKIGDFSSNTINKLIEKGEQDALSAFNNN